MAISAASDRGDFRSYMIHSQAELILRTHDWGGSVKREKTVAAEAVDGEIAVHGSSVAVCIRIDIQKPSTNCLGTSTHIFVWDTETGDTTRVEIPQDDRAPQCVRTLAHGHLLDPHHCLLTVSQA